MANDPKARRSDVRLEPIGMEHAPNMLRWMRDPEVARNLSLSREPSEDGTRAWIEAAQEDDATAALAIVSGVTHVGNVVLDQIDARVRSARLSIYIGDADQRGRGLGSAGVALGVRHAFEDLGLNRVWLLVHCQNVAAIRAYVRVGFSVEGVLRDALVLDDQLVPAFLMATLSSDPRPADA